MKNIQVIDGAVNCVYDVFAATDEEFSCIVANSAAVYTIDVGNALPQLSHFG